MKLIPQQVEILKAELSKLRQRKQELIDSKSNTYAICHENQTGDNDRELIDSIATLNVRMNKIQRILDNAEVVEPRTDGKIGIGTKFDMLLTTPRGRVKEETRTLIETKVTLEDMSQYLTLETDLGKAILGLQAGEEFSYTIPNGKTMFGTVTAIRKENISSKGHIK